MGTVYFQFYRDNAGEYRWRLRSRNGKVIADSGEGYTRERDAVRAAANVKELIYDAWETWLSNGDGDEELEIRDEEEIPG